MSHENKSSKVAQELIAALEIIPLSLPDLTRIAGVRDTTSVRNWKRGLSVPHPRALARLQFAEDMFIFFTEQANGQRSRYLSHNFFFAAHAALEGMNVIDYIGRYGNTRPEKVMEAARLFALC